MKQLTWNFIETGENTGGFNMSFDEQLVQHLVEGTGSPTVRLYQWKPRAISLGRHQNLLDIDAQQCKNDGIDVVRRPTGGRAILHAEELTYSVVMFADKQGIHEVYNNISIALVEGLKIFGVDVALQRSQPNFSEMYKNPSSIPCFSSSARYEIESMGKKLVGSAQRRYATSSGDVVLQHGSILCGPAHRHLTHYLALDDESARKNICVGLEEKTTDLWSLTGRQVDMKGLSECMRKGFESAWEITFNEITSSNVQESYV